MALFSLKKPEDVFTPRSATVNDEMYIDRSELETRLVALVGGTKHIIIHGESGNGKTWLYKKVFAETKTPYAVVNLANAARSGSIAAAMKEKISRTNGDQKKLVQVIANTSGEFLPGGVGVKFDSQRVYETAERDPLEALMDLIRQTGRSRAGLIVFDNFETVLENDVLIAELANILILLDDEDYARYNVKICIVGVPAEIRDYITKLSSVQSLTNRISELPEVARLTNEQAKALLKKGFQSLLKFRVEAEDEVYSRLLWSTDRIAQNMHELGLEVAYVAHASKVVNLDVLERAESHWFEAAISSIRQVVDTNMNARETKAGRRNQVLYALGCIKTEDFKYSDVEAVVRAEFPETTEGVELNIFQRLGELENGTHPIIKRVPKGDAYRVINPKVKIAIRVMLIKKNGRVEKVPFIT